MTQSPFFSEGAVFMSYWRIYIYTKYFSVQHPTTFLLTSLLYFVFLHPFVSPSPPLFRLLPVTSESI